MSIQTISYADKTAINTNPEIADTNKVNANELSIFAYNLITNGAAIKTGRKIDGKDEYIKRIALRSFPDLNGTKEWNTGISMTNVVITDIKVVVVSNIGNWFILPNNDTVDSKVQLNGNGAIRITMYTGNLYNENGYADIYYYHTS